MQWLYHSLHVNPPLHALPYANASALHGLFSTEGAGVLGVLRHLHLLDRLSETGSVPGAVLPNNPHLLGSLCHFSWSGCGALGLSAKCYR